MTLAAMLAAVALVGCDKVAEKAKGQRVYLIVFRVAATNHINSGFSETLVKCDTLTPEVINDARNYVAKKLDATWDTNSVGLMNCTRLYE